MLKAQIGVKLGTTISNFYSTQSNHPYQDYDIDLRPYLGYEVELVQTNPQKPIFTPYLGLFYTLNLSNRVNFRPELSYTQKGVNFSSTANERIIYKVKINYIQLPLSVTYQFLQKEKSTSELYFGGFAAFKINAYKKMAFHNAAIEKSNVDAAKNLDAGLHLGINYRHILFERFFLFDLRLSMGLTNILEQPDNWTSIYFDMHKIKNASLELTVGYEF